MSTTIASERYLIATDQKIAPHVYKTLPEADTAAELLAYRSHCDAAIYRLSDAGCVALWRQRPGHVEVYDRVKPALVFRPDGSSWLDNKASA